MEKERRIARAKEHAAEMRAAKLGPKHVNIDPFVALPIICFTNQASCPSSLEHCRLLLTEREKHRCAFVHPKPRHISHCCRSFQVQPDDLRAYMEVGMDGCVSKPLDETALLATVRAAAPQHGKPLPEKTTHAVGAAGKPPVAKKMGILGTIQDGGPGPHHPGSSALAAQSLSLPSSMAAADGSVSGVLQLDAETALPYTVVDFSMSPDGTDCDS